MDFHLSDFKIIFWFGDTIVIDHEDFFILSDGDIHKISREIASLDELSIYLSKGFFREKCTKSRHQEPTPLLHQCRSIESIGIWSEKVCLPEYLEKFWILRSTQKNLRIRRENKSFLSGIFYEFEEFSIFPSVDVESEKLHILLATEVIIIADDIIFSCIFAALYLDDHEWLCTSIGKSMEMLRWDIASFIWTEHTDLLHLSKIWITDIDGCYTRNDRPVLTTSLV